MTCPCGGPAKAVIGDRVYCSSCLTAYLAKRQPLTPADPRRPPGHTCPALDRVARTIRRHVPEPERSERLADVEELREAHVRLRELAR